VLDASTVLAGPLTCQLLGDYGADVVKIEDPRSGDPMRGHGYAKHGQGLWWKMLARNKHTLGLYLGDPEGAELFRRLADGADVVVENFRPGTMERWGCGWEQLSARNPGLVMCRLTGWGQDGPYASRPGFGTLAEAMSGFAHLTGDPDRPPTLPSFGLADTMAAVSAASAVTMALYHRDAAGGAGQQIDVNILEPIMAAVAPAATYYDQLGIVQTRSGNTSMNNAPRNIYRTKDDRYVAVSTSADRIAARVMELVGHPEVIDEPWFASGRQRAEHAELLDGYVAEWIAVRTRGEAMEAFAEAGAAVAPVYAPDELVADPHVQEREMFTEVEDPDLGPMLMQNVFLRFSQTPGGIRWTGRDLGADTDAILTGELGMDQPEIDELRERGVVG
jgi:crotonobetainyl-CoA:carnitine CoA-transferase CaiB-like acyl-CoA transferase